MKSIHFRLYLGNMRKSSLLFACLSGGGRGCSSLTTIYVPIKLNQSKSVNVLSKINTEIITFLLVFEVFPHAVNKVEKGRDRFIRYSSLMVYFPVYFFSMCVERDWGQQRSFILSRNGPCFAVFICSKYHIPIP